MSEARPLVFVLLEDERDLPLIALGVPLGEVIAVSCAAFTEASRVDALLERAIALGAKRGARVIDPVIAGVDYLAIAHVLACAVRHLCEAMPEAPMLVLAGDRGRGAVGPAVAERLAVPHLGAVRTVQLADARVTVDRLSGAEMRRYSGATPVVLACTLGGPPGLAGRADDVPRVEGAKVDVPAGAKSAIESLALETLQITTPELQYRRRFRPAGGPGPMPRPHLVSSVEVLGDRLLRDGLWPVPREDSEAPGEPKGAG